MRPYAGRRGCNEVKDLEMRSSSIIQISVLIKVRLRRRTWMKKEEAM